MLKVFIPLTYAAKLCITYFAHIISSIRYELNLIFLFPTNCIWFLHIAIYCCETIRTVADNINGSSANF